MNKEYEVLEENKGMRLDVWLTKQLRYMSRSKVQQAIKSGYVSINGVATDRSHNRYNIITGDIVRITKLDEISPKSCSGIGTVPKGETMNLDLVYEDAWLLVINKPAGLVTHPGAGNERGTMVNGLIDYLGYEGLSSIGGADRPGIVHRIDKDTSGLLIVAKTDEVHIQMASMIREHNVIRKYIAVVHGNIKEGQGTVDRPLIRDSNNRMKRAVSSDGTGKAAITHYKVIESMGEYTLLECTLETGRNHQIRAHMAYLKHPLVGDPLYGPKKGIFANKGQLLHAAVIGFYHPWRSEYIELSVTPPEEFFIKLEKIRKRGHRI